MRGAPAGRFQWYAGSGIGARGMDLRRFLRRGVPYSIIRYIAPDARRMSVMAVLRPGAESGRFSPIYPSDLLRRIARSVPGGGLAVHCGTRFSSRPVFPRYISKCPAIPEKGRCRSISYPARSPQAPPDLPVPVAADRRMASGLPPRTGARAPGFPAAYINERHINP
jgi:hypothetical protein